MSESTAVMGGALLLAVACGTAWGQGARPLRPVGEVGVGWEARGTEGAVSAGGAEAVLAGMSILRAGGNAADAAVATILALGVTDAHLFCLGGEVPLLVYDAKRRVVESVSGQGVAPRLAVLERVAGETGIPTTGLAPAAVPAVIDACVVMLERYGTLRFSDAAAPTLTLLDRGTYDWHADLARTLRVLCAAEQACADRLQGLRRVSDLFYRGEVARAIDAWSRKAGGLLRYEDLATHVTRVEDAVSVPYRGHVVYKCGAWTQGPFLLQALRMLEGDDLAGLSSNKTDYVHTIIEVMKLGLADRDLYYADPLFVEVPLAGLLDREYGRRRRALVDTGKASLELRPGNPRTGAALAENAASVDGVRATSNDTTTCLVVDRFGNVVAATPSGWSGVLAGETGIWLGTRLQSFRVEADHPNALVPGKRPRITLTPTLVLKEGSPVAAVSVAGGDLQDQVSLQILLDLIDLGQDAAQAAAGPRFSTDHHIGSFAQTAPRLGSLTLDERLEELREPLMGKGHAVSMARGVIGAPSVLTIDPVTRSIHAAGDPRAGRHSAAY